MDFLLWMLKVENLHIFHQSDEILHIFMEPFICKDAFIYVCIEVIMMMCGLVFTVYLVTIPTCGSNGEALEADKFDNWKPG